MKILICMDSFKGNMSASQACSLVADGLRRSLPGAELVIVPVGDGGEGTADAIGGALGGQWVERKVTGPLPDRRVASRWMRLNRSGRVEAVVEMAQASGMALLRRDELNPLRTTTRGTGELMDHARRCGAGRIYLGVGGSATVDCGTGAAAALGWRFRDERGQEVPPCGGNLLRMRRIVPPPEMDLPPVVVLCDVDNPLCGPRGAARVFAPQKGADPAMVETLEDGLEHMAALIRRELGVDVRDMPGAGAAGGLAAGAVAFMGAELASGIDTVIRITRLDEYAREADWIVTGEGSFDEQSLMGKVVSGIVRLARRHGVAVAVIAGRVGITRGKCPQDIRYVLALSTPGEDQAAAISESAVRLVRAAEKLGRTIRGEYPTG
ncbi:MAG TPA: glycerate kinase [Kiritimatiellae bacterium]|nr:glycerate kinase [Kiritimatiellia bacterium]